MNLVEKMSSDLCLDPSYITSIIRRSRFYYKDYYIKKRNGGERKISQASPELKTLQYWVVYNILKKLPISNSAYAYQKGASIKKHAKFHCDSKHIFHTDICSFFPSISFEKLDPILSENIRVFTEVDIDFDSRNYIKDICFRDNRLCIGTVSSPIISNIIMYEFDSLMLNYCNQHNLKYSRYADDIYFSSNSFIDISHIDYLQSKLKEMGFTINNTKTYFSSPKYCRRVTGLILGNNSSVTIGSQRRNLIKKLVYNKLVHNEGDPESILGYLAFLKDIEPQTFDNLIVKYSRYCKDNMDIIEALKK